MYTSFPKPYGRRSYLFSLLFAFPETGEHADSRGFQQGKFTKRLNRLQFALPFGFGVIFFGIVKDDLATADLETEGNLNQTV